MSESPAAPHLRPLFVMRLAVRPIVAVGTVAGGPQRRIGIVPGGTFEGDRLSGEVLDGGNDWQWVRGDGSTLLDVRLVLRTSDGALVGMSYRGIRHGPAEVISRLENGEAVDASSYYFRINPLFETASPTYEWLNRIVGIGTGHRLSSGPVYRVYEVS